MSARNSDIATTAAEHARGHFAASSRRGKDMTCFKSKGFVGMAPLISSSCMSGIRWLRSPSVNKRINAVAALQCMRFCAKNRLEEQAHGHWQTAALAPQVLVRRGIGFVFAEHKLSIRSGMLHEVFILQG